MLLSQLKKAALIFGVFVVGQRLTIGLGFVAECKKR